MSESLNVIEINATLFFKQKPGFTQEQLIASWGKEGYTCEPIDEVDALVSVFRGETVVSISHPCKVNGDEYPAYYPAIADIEIDYDSTYLINHSKAFADYKTATYKMELCFRIAAQNNCIIPQQEFVLTLLGIQQEVLIQAMYVHHLGIFIGSEDIEEYTAYVNTQSGIKESIPYPMFFGVLVKNVEDYVQAWTTGLEYFYHKNIILSSPNIAAFDSAKILFNSGMEVIRGRKFKAGETMQTGNLYCKIENTAFDDGIEALAFIPFVG